MEGHIKHEVPYECASLIRILGIKRGTRELEVSSAVNHSKPVPKG